MTSLQFPIFLSIFLVLKSFILGHSFKSSIIQVKPTLLKRQNKIQPKSLRDLKTYLGEHRKYSRDLTISNGADLFVNKLLVRNVAADDWINLYDTTCSELGIHMRSIADKIWVPYMSLLSGEQQTPYNFISIKMSTKLAVAITDITGFRRTSEINRIINETVEHGFDGHFALYAYLLDIDESQAQRFMQMFGSAIFKLCLTGSDLLSIKYKSTSAPTLRPEKKPTDKKSINIYEGLIKGLAGQELEECTECFSEDVIRLTS
ncbi:hypothetical protein SNEBB_007399 [Seison nebaliae]|nr:hypothetical protein SNEBB_007399 [Seison nebaliae]